MPDTRARSRGIACALFVAATLVAPAVWAHPGSGIVVDDPGDVYFVHAEVGVWKAVDSGKLELLHWPTYHFMTADPGRRFANQHWPPFPDGEVRAVGEGPSFLLSSSFPLTVGPDGALYYPEAARDGHVHIMRLVPSGEPSDVAALPIAMEIGYDGEPVAAQWIHGLAAGPDGALYYAEKRSVRRISRDGVITPLAEEITVPDCVRPSTMPADGRGGPILRGLDVGADGTVYVAASGCSAVLKIAPDGAVSVALRATDEWSPAGVDVVGDDLYVLEHRYVETQRAADWLPRVRKLAPDGTVTVIATVKPSDARP